MPHLRDAHVCCIWEWESDFMCSERMSESSYTRRKLSWHFDISHSSKPFQNHLQCPEMPAPCGRNTYSIKYFCCYVWLISMQTLPQEESRKQSLNYHKCCYSKSVFISDVECKCALGLQIGTAVSIFDSYPGARPMYLWVFIRNVSFLPLCRNMHAILIKFFKLPFGVTECVFAWLFAEVGSNLLHLVSYIC